MDMSPAWVWPVAVALLLVLAGGGALLTRWSRAGRRRSAGEAVADRDGSPVGGDDLPGFLEFPPGSAGGPATASAGRPPPAGWPPLAAPAPDGNPPAAEAPTRPRDHSGRRTVVLAAVALVALLLLTVLVVDPRPGRSGHGRTGEEHGGPPPAPPDPEPGQPGAGDLAHVSVKPGREGGAARLAFAGLVLEQRAVGVTAAYPEVEVTWNRDHAVAHLRLRTYNCLTATAPEDPAAAGCLPSIAEYADLSSPALEVSGNDGTVLLRGRFPTYVRPNGSPPEWTGRQYEFSLRAAPVAGERGDGWVRAHGEIRLGEGRAGTLETPEVTVLRRD